MPTRKLIMYDILVTYYKNYSNKPKELISRSTDLTYKKEIAVVFALSMVDDINRSKKKLLSAVGCNGKEYCSLKAEDFSIAKRRKAIRKILNKLLEESDVAFMLFSYADNKTVEVVINKTKHNHSAKRNKEALKLL
jgi:predicted HAD superfamily phosphohydrolase